MNAPVILLDACVLAPHPLFDTLLRLAEVGLYVPKWSETILEETERTLINKLGEPASKARKRITSMDFAFPDAMVTDFEHLIGTLINHSKDRHVLAAAIIGGAETIVTANLKDFPPRALESYEVVAQHPDEFLLQLLDRDPQAVLECLRRQRSEYAKPPQSLGEFYGSFRSTVPRFANAALSAELKMTNESSSSGNEVSVLDMPAPLVETTMEEMAQTLFPDGEPDIFTPHGAASMWWLALLNIDKYRIALENLTDNPAEWNGFASAIDDLDGWVMTSGVHYYDEAPDKMAYVKFIPDPGFSALAFDDSPIRDVQILVLVRDDASEFWRAWGICRNRIPTYSEITGAAPQSTQ